MQNKIMLHFLVIFISIPGFGASNEEKPEIPVEVVKKLEQLRKGDLNQLEKIKLADQLQRAGAKPEALALYEENLPIDFINKDLPPEAYLNYGTALLENGEEQKGLAVYNTLAESLSKNTESQKIKEILEKNVVNYFQVQEQKKKEEEQKKKEKKENKNKENKDQKENQQGDGESEDQKNQQGQDPKDQQDKKGQGEQSKDQQDKKDGKSDEKDKKEKEKGDEKDTDEKGDNDKNNEEKDKNESGKEGDGKKVPPSKMSPKLKQLMSDDRQLQLKVIEQGTRDMNRRQNRENKDW
jgi:hypothetical protein